MYSCGPIFMSGNYNGILKHCKVKEQSIYLPTNSIRDTQLQHIYMLHVSTQRCHPQRLIIANVYNQHNNIFSAPPYKVLL